MKKNVGSTDTIVRIVLAVVVAVLIGTKVITGTSAIILGIVAAALLLTGIFGFCLLYTLFGISTCKVKKGSK